MLLPLRFLITGVSLLIVLWTGRGLPDIVTSHFDAAGGPDGYLDRSTFVAISALVVCGAPQFVMWFVTSSVRRAGFRVSNAAYWLARERIDETERYLARWATVLGAMLAGFLLFCHLQVVSANLAAVTPPIALDIRPLLGALALLIVAMTVALAILDRHFRRV